LAPAAKAKRQQIQLPVTPYPDGNTPPIASLKSKTHTPMSSLQVFAPETA
jgi:hypothetical protein